MKLLSLFIASLLMCFTLHAQSSYEVLHYTETSGWDHLTRTNSYNMFNSFPMLNVTQDNDGSEFDSLATLLNYDLIVFSNTSGDQLLDSMQQSHFEQYIQNGGSLLGIHAATDTYRHSSANGSSTGSWDFYAECIGGSVQQNPNHVSGTPAYDIYKVGLHPTTDTLPDPWLKNEEYYYWENGYLDTNIQVILKVEETVGPNNQVNSYDSSRAVSWYKEKPNGSRIFYTSMGHSNTNYTSDSLFRGHIFSASLWCLGVITSVEEATSLSSPELTIYPNPAKNHIKIDYSGGDVEELHLVGMDGRIYKPINQPKFPVSLDINSLAAGTYAVVLELKKMSIKKLFIKQ